MARSLKIAAFSGIILILSLLLILSLFFFGLEGITRSYLDSPSGSNNPFLEGIDGFIGFLVSFLYYTPTIPFIFLFHLAGIFFFYGFVSLGKRFNVKKLKITAWIFIATNIVLFILFLIALIYKISSGTPSLPLSKIYFFLLSFIDESFFGIILSIILGIGLINLHKQGVEYSKISGILEIVFKFAGPIILFVFFILYLIFVNILESFIISFVILLVGVILALTQKIIQIIMFFKASRKYEHASNDNYYAY